MLLLGFAFLYNKSKNTTLHAVIRSLNAACEVQRMKLYRYISFEEFVNLLTTKSMHYSCPTKWEDTYEGYMFRSLDDVSHRTELLKRMWNEIPSNIPDFEKALSILKNYCKIAYARYHWYGQCWTREANENDASRHSVCQCGFCADTKGPGTRKDSVCPGSYWEGMGSRKNYFTGSSKRSRLQCVRLTAPFSVTSTMSSTRM